MTPLQDDEIAAGLPEGWRYEGGELVHDHDAPDFAGALAYVNAVGALAEREDHHPDLLLHGWNHVRVTLSTHSAGGVTALDLALAAKIADL